MDALIHMIEKILDQNVFLALLLAYLGGVLTTFTPCVYPMIPVTLAITLGTENDGQARIKKLWNPFFYCLGIAVTYSLLGVFAAATGTLFGRLAGNPWLYLVLALVFIVLGLNALGILILPTLQFQYRADRAHKVSLFLFGALTGVIFSPCTAPLLGVFLAYASTRSLFIGGLLLFCYAAGFSSILLLIAWGSLYAKDRIPKSGAWLGRSKYFIVGICFLAAAFLLYRAWILFAGKVFL